MDRIEIKEVNNESVSIIDIRKPDFSNFGLEPLILSGLQKPLGKKKIPTLVLYDDKGLQLFDESTYLKDYYLTSCKIDILKNQVDIIIKDIPDGSIVIEFGSGSLRKTKILLDSLNLNRKDIKYYALDLMEFELIKSLKNMGKFENVKCFGLWGTYEDGLEYLKTINKTISKSVLWLGASIGNLDRKEAIEFVFKVKESLNLNDKLMIGIDLRNPFDKITRAYNDPKGVNRNFILNGLTNTNNILNQPLFNLEQFEYSPIVNMDQGFRESRYKSKIDQQLIYKVPNSTEIIEMAIKKDEEIQIGFSYKYSFNEIKDLIDQSQFKLLNQLLDSTNSYTFNILSKP